MLDIEKLTDALVEHTLKAVEANTAPLLARIDDLEKQLSQVRASQAVDIGAMIAEKVSQAIPVVRDGKDGRDGASVVIADVMPALQKQVSDYLAAIPVPKDGVDGKDGTPGESGAPGADGKSVTAEDVAPVLIAFAQKFLEDLPIPRDGKDGNDGKDGEPGTAGRDGAPGRDGVDGKDGADGADGIGLAGALIGRSGDLIVTLTNGETNSLGIVVGRDGLNGRDGADGAAGRDGRDGQHGLGFEDLSLVENEAGRVASVSRLPLAR